MSGGTTPKAHPNIYSELLLLSKSITPWQNEILRRAFKKGELSQEDKNEILQLALTHYGLEKELGSVKSLMLTSGDLPSPPTPGQQLKLNSVLKLINVNALMSDQRLLIGDQLTILYGENATGKSGYARVMKKAFRAREVDKILPNVYSKTPPSGPPSAVFEVEENGDVREEVWSEDAVPIDCLGRFAVFDAKCGRAYLTSDSQLSFLPYGFDILESLTNHTDEVKLELKTLSQKASPKPDALKLFSDSTSIGQFIVSLNAESHEKELELKASWSDADDAALANKETELGQLKLKDPQALRVKLEGLKQSLQTIKGQVSKVERAISSTQVSAIKDKCSDINKYDQAIVTATQAGFSDIELDGVGTPVWQALIRAAAKYSTEVAYPGQLFPANQDGVKCVLCQQSLDQKAQERLRRFWEFIQGEMSTKRDEAKVILGQEMTALTTLPREMPPTLEPLMTPLRAYGSVIPDGVKHYFLEAAKRIVSIEYAVAMDDWESPISNPNSPSPVCDLEIVGIDAKLASLSTDHETGKLISSLSNEIDELKARKRLKENISTVQDHLRSLKRSKVLAETAGKINTTALTKKATELHQKLVTDEFKNNVQKQLVSMGLISHKAAINEKPKKGKVFHKIAVVDAPTVDPEAVFSEGERTALALACFVAELSANEDNCAIIFDDPVSSLDHKIREGVAKLLVSEATNRQVIIFTHDLVFYRELYSLAKRQGVFVTFQHIERLGDNLGLVSNLPPWFAMSVGQRIAELEKRLGEAKRLEDAGNISEYRLLHGTFYSLLRSTWERSVEELLFNNVIQRLEFEVATQSLRGVSVDQEAIEMVFDGMSRASSMIDAHDPATAKGKSLANCTELQKDVQDLREFQKKQKRKIEESEKQLDHLEKSKAGK